MIAKSVLVAALLACASSIASAAPALATRDLTVRAQPAGAAAVVGRIPGGSTVDARNCGQVWCWVGWASVSGYVIRNYLDLGYGPAPGYGAYGPPPPPAYAYGYGPPPPPAYPYAYPYPYYGYGPYWRPWYRW
jgi:hypothetical protein